MEDIIDNLSKLNIQEFISLEDYETLLNSSSKNIKEYGEVYTPFSLVDEMLDKLPNEIWKNKFYTFFEPAAGLSPFILRCYYRLMEGLKEEFPDEEDRQKWIIENMLYMNEIQPKNVTAIKKIYQSDKYKVNIFEGDFLTLDFSLCKFSVILGNPPYQPPNKGNNDKLKATGSQIWPEFIRKSLNLVVDYGYMLMIHPPGWRKPGGRTQDLFSLLTKDNTIEYLEMCDNKGKNKIFDCGVKIDWYILKKQKCYKDLTYKDQKGNVSTINLDGVNFLPNYNIERIINMTNSNIKINFICDKNSYSTGNKKNKDILSDIKDENHPYTLIHSTPKKGIVYKYCSVNNKGIFGIPKIIFGDSGPYHPVIDLYGEYGMTEHAMAIKLENENIDLRKQEGEFYKNVLSCDDFFDILHSIMWSNFQIDKFFMELLNKDFYRYIDIEIKKIEIMKNDDDPVLNDQKNEESSNDITNELTKEKILEITTVVKLKELLTKYNISGRSSLKKNNMDKFKELLIQKLELK